MTNDLPSDLRRLGHWHGRVPTTPEGAAEVMAYLRDVHEFRDTAGEHPTPVEVMGEDGEPVTPL